ncbi:MAG: hypothetical protein U9Q74_01230 [Gemmatimonadota bacterium]|nr:hypothetical protein [Gemmatimonadota bacterium]
MRYTLLMAGALVSMGAPGYAQQKSAAKPPTMQMTQGANMQQMMAQMDTMAARAQGMARGMAPMAGHEMMGGSHQGMEAMAAHVAIMAREMKAFMEQMQAMEKTPGLMGDSAARRDMDEMHRHAAAMPAAMGNLMQAMEHTQKHMASPPAKKPDR